ncbi:MAG: hypothetical protein ACREQD_00615 [Candidatus Binataceae bacterium]
MSFAGKFTFTPATMAVVLVLMLRTGVIVCVMSVMMVAVTRGFVVLMPFERRISLDVEMGQVISGMAVTNRNSRLRCAGGIEQQPIARSRSPKDSAPAQSQFDRLLHPISVITGISPWNKYARLPIEYTAGRSSSNCAGDAALR